MSYFTLICQELRHCANPQRKAATEYFYKTKKGEYGAHDVFIGVPVPESRLIAKKYQDAPLSDIKKLLASKVHEERLVALFLLVRNFDRSGIKDQKRLYHFYLENISGVNNWDLVDASAHKIIGAHLLHKKDRHILKKLAESNNLWERRIAVVATWTLIKDDQYDDILKIAKMLLNDSHDLIHKAVGWMLREMGKRDVQALKDFLDKNIRYMPRTMLRYAIEKFPETERKEYLMR